MKAKSGSFLTKSRCPVRDFPTRFVVRTNQPTTSSFYVAPKTLLDYLGLSCNFCPTQLTELAGDWAVGHNLGGLRRQSFTGGAMKEGRHARKSYICRVINNTIEKKMRLLPKILTHGSMHCNLYILC